MTERRLTIGFPRMYNEPGERRAFLPPLAGLLADTDVDVYVEAGSGEGMGYPDDAYRAVSPRVRIVDEATAYAQDVWSCSGRGGRYTLRPARSTSRCSTSPPVPSGSRCCAAS